jgi:hypothetical protein
VGPIIGGFLNRPTEEIPTVFGHCTFLHHYPYFLPPFVSAVVSFIGIIVFLLLFQETERRNFHHTRDAVGDTTPLLRQDDELASFDGDCRQIPTPCFRSSFCVKPSQFNNARTLRKSKSDSFISREHQPISILSKSDSGPRKTIGSTTCLTIALYSLLALCNIMIDEIFNLWAAEPHSRNGLGFDSARIGLSLASVGAIEIIFQIWCFPWIARRCTLVRLFQARYTDKVNVLRLTVCSMAVYGPIIIMMPFM